MSEDIETDISIIASFEHPNIATYETFFFTKQGGKTFLAVIRPYFKSNIGEVASFTKFSAADNEICEKLIKALNYIHDKYSMVFTLKKSNVFVDSNGEIQITDIAIPALLDYELEDKKNNLKLAMYCPPEINKELLGVTYKCDIWNLGVMFYELYKKSHPYEAESAKEASKLISKGFDGVEMDNRIMDDIIKACLKTKPIQRANLANIKRMLKNLVEQEKINLEEASVRRTSYGLVSLNKSTNLAARQPESGTERLDDQSEDHKFGEDMPHTDNFFKILHPDAFNAKTYASIVYNEKPDGDVTDPKAKFKCINVNNDCHDGPINGIAVIETGLVVTSGDDKTIKFWNPLDNECLAIINETQKVGSIITFPKVKQFYYVVGKKIKCFDYSIGVATTIYEGLSDITCVSRLDDGQDTSK